jgi:CHAT domain-containing protein
MRRLAHPGPLVAALQSLAAAFYQLSRYSEVGAATEYLGKAIESAREAQNILRTKGELDDARMIRILIDLGVYQFEHGVKTGEDQVLLQRAEEDFQAAISSSSPERSPWLVFRASLGLFRLLCHKEEWERALEAFAQMEKAWAVAVTDQQLSHEVHDQKVTEMEGVYSLAAYCCLMVSDVEGAVGILERGRAQKMSLFPAGATASGSTVSEKDRSELVTAIDQWEWSRNLGSLEECQRAWRTYERLLRKHGLGMMPTSFDATGLKRILPIDAVMVHLFDCPAGVFAILTFGDGREAQQVIIPPEFRQKLNLLLWSPETQDGRCWGTEYRRFRDPLDKLEDESEATFQSWHETVEEVIDLLGVNLLQPIHDELMRHEFPRKGRVYLAPPGEFAALPLSSGRLADGSIFEEHWQVSLIPNGTFLPQEEEDEATEQSMLAVGHRSGIKGERGLLRFVSREAELVGKHLPAESKSLLLDEGASVETTLTKMREASVIHMACHGTFEIRTPESSGIHLPGGELLPIARLKRTDRYHLNARLVFLSCCESGITGWSIPPDEFVGFLPSLLKCGARAAIGSLWPVYDDAAMCLCLKFYQVYLDEDGTPKMNPAAALSSAKSWLREVSAAELIETGWISENEIIEILGTRRNTRMLRIRPVGDSQPIPEWDESASTPQEHKASPEQLKLKPFSSPVDWAAFILLGA